MLVDTCWKVTRMERSGIRKAFSGLERILLASGLVLLCVYAAARFYGAFSSHAEVQRFWQSQKSASAGEAADTFLPDSPEPDFQLWSPQRIAAYKASVDSAAPIPVAVLKIPAINLEVPVLEGTDDFTLNRAVGHIEGTPTPGQDGNIGIAGHRDGFFRGFKDIHVGDAVALFTKQGTDHYIVDEVLIVSPDDVSVLGPRGKPSLTLVTCYPFYFVGSAPQRFIVHASMANHVDRPNHRQPALSAGKGGGQESH